MESNQNEELRLILAFVNANRSNKMIRHKALAELEIISVILTLAYHVVLT